MYYPTDGDRVRVIGRVFEYSIVSANHTTRVAEICLDFDGMGLLEVVPFSMLLECMEFVGARSEEEDHAMQLTSSRWILSSTAAHVNRSAVLIADLRVAIAVSMQMIRASEQLIRQSDLAIAGLWGMNGDGSLQKQG